MSLTFAFVLKAFVLSYACLVYTYSPGVVYLYYLSNDRDAILVKISNRHINQLHPNLIKQHSYSFVDWTLLYIKKMDYFKKTIISFPLI